MGQARRIIAVAAALGAIAVAAAPAYAVKTKETGKFTGTGSPRAKAEGEQEFSFKPFKITCEKAKGKGEAEVSATELSLSVKYSGCKAEAKLGKVDITEVSAKFKAPVALTYSAAGKISIAEPIEISIGGAVKCKLTVESVTEVGKATYETKEETTENLKKFPTGIQDKLLITNGLRKLSYTREGGLCAYLTSEGKGSYTGALLAEVKNGNLGYESAS
ncbi:MAG: hypothetical protein ABSG95_01485 [Solirubrobacteraceae bacterium]|jgi:hypothetical protein